jgi:hypothetical protein
MVENEEGDEEEQTFFHKDFEKKFSLKKLITSYAKHF